MENKFLYLASKAGRTVCTPFTFFSNATRFTAAEREEVRSEGTAWPFFCSFAQNSRKKAAVTRSFHSKK